MFKTFLGEYFLQRFISHSWLKIVNEVFNCVCVSAELLKTICYITTLSEEVRSCDQKIAQPHPVHQSAEALKVMFQQIVRKKGYKTYLIYADAHMVNYSVLMLLDSFGQPKATSSEEEKDDF